jgi:thiol-disulfide isomerase/thioredoxin
MDSRVAWLTVAAVCMASGCGHAGAGNSTGAAQVARVGHPAPAWSEPSLPGPTLSSASLHGKAVYLNFFATWCPPCNAEAPSIDALARRYGSRGLQVVGVDVLEDSRKAAAFRDEHHLGYPVVVDSGALRDEYRVNGLPVHVFIDRNGIVQQIVVGELSPQDMRADVAHLLH